MPTFGRISCFSWNDFNLHHNYVEPVGSVAPKINAGDKLGITFSEARQAVTLFCPAQSFPVPAYR